LSDLRILIADDHELMRRGVRSLLEAEVGWRVVGEAANGQELVEKTETLRPDVVVLDISMPRLNGLEAAHRIKKILPEVKILILTMHDSEQMVRSVLDAGARGYIAKSDAARDLVTAIEALHRNRTFFPPKVDQLVLDSFLRNESKKTLQDPLTSRQKEIVQLLTEGKTSKEVATLLNLSIKTIETHRANIMKRLHCHCFSDLVFYAIRNNIVHL